MKKLLEISMAAALAATFAATSSEAGERGGKGKRERGDRIVRVLDELDLTPQQQDAIADLRDDAREESGPISAQIRALREKQRVALRAEPIDEDEVVALQKIGVSHRG